MEALGTGLCPNYNGQLLISTESGNDMAISMFLKELPDYSIENGWEVARIHIMM